MLVCGNSLFETIAAFVWYSMLLFDHSSSGFLIRVTNITDYVLFDECWFDDCSFRRLLMWASTIVASTIVASTIVLFDECWFDDCSFRRLLMSASTIAASTIGLFDGWWLVDCFFRRLRVQRLRVRQFPVLTIVGSTISCSDVCPFRRFPCFNGCPFR